MSSTPDPTPHDESAFDATPLDATPLDATPLSGAGADTDEPPSPFVASEADPTVVGEPLADPAPEPPTASRPSAAETAAAMRQSDLKALYAVAGFTEAAVGAVRSTLSDTSRWATARLTELRIRREELAKQAEEVRRIADGLPEDVRAVPQVAKGRVTDLQHQASSTYTDLAHRGQRVLDSVRSDVVNRIDPAFDRLQARVDEARRLVKARATAAAAPAAATDVVVDEVVVVPESRVEEVLVADLTSEPVEPLDVVTAEDLGAPAPDAGEGEPEVWSPGAGTGTNA